ncbi:MAG TPA: BTAD domain-containing putative transcriptional regulator, partial [Propionibacteriaceae bacterium]|nr:BTAD domain-containing putative transcriptional regulator [Propionibacteriaceae bacterium]
MQHGDYEAAIAASQAVLDSGTTDPVQRDHALLNLVTLYFNFGNGEKALSLAEELAGATDPNLRSIAAVTTAILQARTASDMEAINRQLRVMARDQKADRSHHFAVTMANLAYNSIIQDRLQDASREVEEALDAFGPESSLIERASATMAKVQILARIGRVDEAHKLIDHLVGAGGAYQQNETYAEAADVLDSFGSRESALAILDRVGHSSTITMADRRLLALTKTRLLIRAQRFDEAGAALAEYVPGQPTVVGQSAMLALTTAYLKVARGDGDARLAVADAQGQAQSNGVDAARRLGELLAGVVEGGSSLGQAVSRVGTAYPWHLTFLADLLAPRLEAVTSPARDLVGQAAKLHPERWRTDLRDALVVGRGPTNLTAARLLEEIGDESDIPRLRQVAKSGRRTREAANLGRLIARRLAHPVRIEDQGRVSISVGGRELPGTAIRRKVLALLCFLITRGEMSATRDQVLDALWPELDPEIAINSLNQTLYFLRRVFEENYSEDLSPGYVHHDSDVIWLDNDLVTSRSVECRHLIRQLPARPSPDEVERLTLMYRGRFALDFEYEEWAAAHRDSLHAAYLEIVERSVLDDFTAGHYDRGIRIARRALEVDGSAEQIEVSLLRLYRVSGAHSAAAEQYAHYAGVMREELGLEPPPLDAL